MGWLEKLLTERHGDDVSFRKAARQLQARPDWPREETLQPESLAIYLGHFDKEYKLDWLAQHPKVEAALAGFLGLLPEELRAQVESLPSSTPSAEPPLLTLWEVETRRIDLRTEPLPPAFPPKVLEPSTWPILWRAPSGSGRSIVGKWLDAQGRATFVRAETWAEALKQLHGSKPVFIELTSPEGLPASGEGLPPVCIAVDGAPAPSQLPMPGAIVLGEHPEMPFTWTQVVSPPAQSWLEELVAWTEERVSAAHGFDAQACLKWMRQELLPQRIIDRFGTALSFIGLFVKFGGKATKPLPELVGLLLRMRAQQVGSDTEPVKHKELLARLEGLARRLLLNSEHSWQEARSRDQWLELLHSRPDAVDLASLQELSERYSLGVDARKLRRAAEKLPPTAQRTFQQLQQLQLLREKRPRMYVLQPSWLLTVSLSQVADLLLDEAPEAWGLALLRKHSARFMIGGLTRRCIKGDFVPVRRLLSQPSFASAAWVAALECAFRALGLATLYEHEVPRELIEQVLVLQQRLLLERHGEPVPRIGYGHDIGYTPLSHGFWLLAAHALVDKLGTVPSGIHPGFTLDRHASPELLYNVLSQVSVVALEDQSDEKLAFRVLLLYVRLYLRTGPLPTPLFQTRVHPLQLPAYLLQRFRTGSLDWGDFAGPHPWSSLFPLLRTYVEKQHESWESFQQALWKAWLDSEAELDWWMTGELLWIKELWAQLPPQGIVSPRLASVMQDERFPYEGLSAAQWRAFLTSWKNKRAPALNRSTRPWRHMPPEFIRAAIDEGIIHPHESMVFRELWKTAPATVLQALEQLLHQGRWPEALNLAWSAQPAQGTGVLELITQAARRLDAPRESIVFYLHDRITDRAPGWERGWELLQELAAPAPPGDSARGPPARDRRST